MTLLILNRIVFSPFVSGNLFQSIISSQALPLRFAIRIPHNPLVRKLEGTLPKSSLTSRKQQSTKSTPALPYSMPSNSDGHYSGYIQTYVILTKRSINTLSSLNCFSSPISSIFFDCISVWVTKWSLLIVPDGLDLSSLKLLLQDYHWQYCSLIFSTMEQLHSMSMVD